MHYDDCKVTISDHVAAYEKTWNVFAGVIGRADLVKDTGFGRGLLYFSKCEQAKTEFLLKSLPAYYASTIESIRSREQTYDDAARKIKEYITARQKGQQQQRPRDTSGGSAANTNRIVLNDKKCTYCIGKGWQGLNHNETECYTKKRETKANVKRLKRD